GLLASDAGDKEPMRRVSAFAESPLVSVCLVRGDASVRYDACLASILRQTHPNLQILVVDTRRADGVTASMPGSGKIPIRLLIEKGLNRGAARNVAAAQAEGEYLLFVDEGSALLAECVEVLVTAAVRTKADVLTGFPAISPASPASDRQPGRAAYLPVGGSSE